jgi:hypothetical protein
MTAVRQVRLVRAELESPFLSQGLWANSPGLDTALVRDYQDRLIIPGSQLQGVLLSVLREMLRQGTTKFNQAHMVEWFGQGSGDAYDNPVEGLDNPFEPQKGCVHCGDLVCQLPIEDQGATATRIAIDEHTGSVAEGALQVLEQPFPLGKGVHFAGELTFWDRENQAALFWEIAGLALRFVPALGAVKSSGFGNLAHPMELIDQGGQASLVVDLSSAETLTVDDRLAFELEFLEPFVVDAELIGGNIYQGSHIIPGAVIKGCLAQKLEMAGGLADLNAALSQIVISHAFPIKASEPTASRPRAIPFSLIQRDKKKSKGEGYDKKLFDCFWDSDTAAWRDDLIAYPIDWKGAAWEAAKAELGWTGAIGYHVRTRTAIKSAKGVVEKGKLFSYREVIPADLGWRFLVDRGSADEWHFRKIVCALLAGLDFVGKTDARAMCRQVVDASTDAVPARADYAGQPTWRVTLQTPALLLDTGAAIRQPGQEEPPAPHELYQAYWQEVAKLAWTQSPPTVRLVDYRAAQKWEGGYRARRFWQREGRYTPYLLTQPGSVFLLTLEGATPESQQSFFTQVVRRGLPVSFRGKVQSDSPGLWEECPYTPENGYGEVTVDWEDARRFEGGVRLA